MSTNTSRRQQALEACEKVINGIEDGTIPISSSLLLCKRIARLVNDLEGQIWLNYEYGGYPHTENGRIPHDAWIIATEHGRVYQTFNKNGTIGQYAFTELCDELEATIESNKSAIGNFTTQGFSVSGERALLATERMNDRVAQGTGSILKTISNAERHLSILRSQYYDYAVKWQIELCFGNAASSIFDEYQERVDSHFSLLPTNTLRKLNAVQDLMEDENSERYSQVLTSCRRLWSDIANQLFNEVFAGYTEKVFRTKSGKEIDVSGDHDNNKLSAVIEVLQSKASSNTLVGSEIKYLVDWMEQINKMQNSGVHSDITREQAMQCIIHTYIALGDILSLKAKVQSEK